MVLNDISPDHLEIGFHVNSYFSYLFEPPTFDALALVHLSQTSSEALDRRIEKRAKQFHEAGKPVFWIDDERNVTLPDHKYVQEVGVYLDDFQTSDNVEKISKAIGKAHEEITLAFGGVYAGRCVDAHLVSMCRNTYTIHPENDIVERLEVVPTDRPLGTGVVLDDIVEVDNPMFLKELRMRLKFAKEYKDGYRFANDDMLRHSRRIYEGLARESNNDFFKYCCLFELLVGETHLSGPGSEPEKFYNALREIGWYRVALLAAHAAGLKHETDELKDMLRITASLDEGRNAWEQWKLGINPKLVAEDLIQLGDFRKAALTAMRFGGYHLAFELVSRIDQDTEK